jgi:hypothetical protein
MMYTPDEPACDTSDASRAAISEALKNSGFVGVDTSSIQATVDHWVCCKCNVRTFLDTYPNAAIPFKNKEGKTQQVLRLIQFPAHAPASQTPSYSGNRTFPFSFEAHKVGPAQPPPRSATQNPPPASTPQ